MNTTIELDKARRYAWFNLTAGFIAYFYILGFPAVLMPNLYPYIISDTGWSRGEVTSFASYKFITMTLFVFMLAFFIERVGAKRLLIAGIIINGISMACFAFIDSLWMYYGLAVCFGLGAISGNVAIKVLLSRWYYARQGRAVGFALMGSGIAGVVAPVIIEMMTQAIGWKMTVVYLSMGIWILILPLIMYLTHDSPEKFGYTSRDLDAGNDSDMDRNDNDFEQPDFSSVKSRAIFWMIALAIYLVAIVEGGMMQNTKTYLQLDVGFSGEEAAWFFTLLMLTSLVGRYLFGWFYDYLSVKGVSVCFVIVGLGALMALPVTGLFTAFIFCIVRGFGHGGILVEIPVLAKHVFGERSMSRVISIYTGAYSLGMATGGWVFGYSYDYFGSYNVVFLVSIVLCLVSATIVYRARPVFWQRYRHETQA